MLFRSIGYTIVLWVLVSMWSYGGESVGSLENRLRGAVSDTVRVDLLLQLGDHYEHTDFETASRYYEQALGLSRQSKVAASGRAHRNMLRELEVRSLRYLAFLQKSWGYYEEAEESYMELLGMHQSDNNVSGEVRTLTSLGNINYYRSDLIRATEYYTNALKIARDNNLHKPLADLNSNIASIYYLRGNFVKSMDHYQTALDYYRLLDGERNTGLVYLGMGNIHNSLNNFENAKENYFLALQFFDDLDDHRNAATIYLSLGALFFTHQQLDRAEEYYQLALNHAETVNDFRLIAQSFLNLGILKQARNDHNAARTYLEKSLETLEKAPNRHIEASGLRNLAVVFMQTQLFDRAYDYARSSLRIAEEIGSLEDQVESFKVKAEIMQHQRRYNQALEYYVKYKTLSDSLINVQTQKRIAELDAEYINQSKIQTIELQLLELEKNRVELKRKNQIVNTFVVVIVFLIIFSISGLLYLNFKRTAGLEIAKMKKYLDEARDNLIRKTEEIELQKTEASKARLKYNDLVASNGKYIDFISMLRKNDVAKSEEIKADLKNHFFKFPSYHSGPQPTICYFSYSRGCLLVFGAVTNMDIIQNTTLNLLLNDFAKNAFEEIVPENSNKYFTMGYDWLAEKSTSLENSFPDISVKPYMLTVDFINQKVKLISEDFPLYLAVSQHAGGFFRSSFHYQDIQTVHPVSPYGELLKERYSNIKESELKLKPNDRIYLMNVLTNSQEEKIRETGLAYEQDVLRFLQKNQNMELALQGHYFSRKFTDWKGVNQATGLSNYFCLIGVEL